MHTSHLGPGNSGQIGARSGQPRNRILPQRLWAGANPTPLTNKAFAELCRPSQLQPPGPNLAVSNVQLSPLHRFLGCVFLRRSLQLEIKREDNVSLHMIQPTSQNAPQQQGQVNDPGTTLFKVAEQPQAAGLTCKVSSSPNNSYQSLHLEVKPDLPVAQQWPHDMLHTLQKFFDVNVASPPYRPSAITAFCRILVCPINALKDIIAIMRYEMHPETVIRDNLKWTCKLCLTMPPAAPPLIPLGQPGLLTLKDKMLLFLQLTRTNAPPGSTNTTKEPLSFVIPLVYDIKANQTSVAQKEMNQVIGVAQRHLAQLSTTLSPQRCTLLPAVHDLLQKLTLPDEGATSQTVGGHPPGGVGHPPGGVPLGSAVMRGQNPSK